MKINQEFLLIPSKRKDMQLRILPKEVFDELYLKNRLPVLQIIEDYGLTYKIFNDTYQHWYTREQRKKMRSERVSRNQTVRNSNKDAYGKPRIILPKESLEEMNNLLYTPSKIAREFNVSMQTVMNNLSYHGIDAAIRGSIRQTTLNSIYKMEHFTGKPWLKDFLDLDDPQSLMYKIMEAEQEVTNLREHIRAVRKSVMGRCRNHNIVPKDHRLPGSQMNSMFKVAFDELGYPTTCEFEIENHYYDFRIKDTNILIEIDSDCYHTLGKQISNDAVKTKKAENAGFVLMRIRSDKDKFITMKKKALKCIQALKSNGLLQ